MNFITAVKTCFQKYVDFNGRARRSEYWFFCLFGGILGSIVAIIAGNIGSSILSLILFLPNLAVNVRRLHDVGKKGTWIFIAAIPIVGIIWFLVLCCKDSEYGENRFGPNPKAEEYDTSDSATSEAPSAE